MRKWAKTWLTAGVAGGIFTLAFGVLALVLYSRTERGVVARHIQDQRLLAELAATALAQRADAYVHRADAQLATLPPRWSGRAEQQLQLLQPLAPGGAVFLVADGGALTFRERPADAEALEAAVRPWRGAREPVLTNPFPRGASPGQVALLVPWRGARDARAQIGFTLPFALLTETLAGENSQAAHLSLALLDEDGLVLTNTRHPEMTGRRLPGAGQSCLPCHTSFELERKMLAGEAGVGEVQVGQAPLALLAYAPVRLLGRRWALSLSEPYSAVTADTRRGFRDITLLLGLMLLLGIAAITLTLQYREQRRRAEERARQAERRAALERELRQSEQLASIGRMTSHIAHQINTPLATLGLNVAYLRTEVARRCGASREVEEVSDALAEEIDRLKRVVNDYLRFARLPQPVLREESLPPLVEGFLEFVGPEARERGVRLDVELGGEPALVQLDAELFRQAFLNLVRNSFEAMPAGGTLTVRLRRAGEDWELEVSDTGRGIPPEALPRIFDPFFTTKKDGTGLGLAHTRRVIEEHGGSIEGRSRPGQGTTFIVRLPAAAPAAKTPEEFSLSEKGR